MRLNEIAPATTIRTLNINTTKRWCRANWTMRWIMRSACGLSRVGALCAWAGRFLVLQRVLELQEQAAVAYDVLAFLETFLYQGAAVLAVADFHQPPGELLGGHLHVHERLIFRVA